MNETREAMNEVIALLNKGASFTSDEVMKLAERVAKEIVAEKTKFRQYFQQIKELARALKSGEMKEERVKVELYKMKARVAYDTKRPNVRGMDSLKPLIDASVDKIMRSSDLKKEIMECSDFFECLVGYHYAK
ncbi:MAG: type III-A CRISPR-associated protein Csm2 [candidate division WOR-3 bacterium]